MHLQPGMMMDILAAVILLISLIRGAKTGFARTLVSFMQWFICIIAGFILCSSVKEYLITQTELDDAINSYILDQVGTSIEQSAPYMAMPDLFSQWIQDSSTGFVYGTTASLTDVILTVIAFIVVILAIKLLCWFFVWIFSKEHHDGLIGFLDSLVGLLFGAVRGVLLILLLFAFLVPVLCLLPGTLSETLKTAMDQSSVASFLYDDNLLLILVRDLFS